MSENHANSDKQKKKKDIDIKSIEDHIKDIPDIDNIEIPENVRERLEDATPTELDDIEREFGMSSDEPLLIDESGFEEKETSSMEEEFEDGEEEEESVDGKIDVSIAEDRMSASINLYPSRGGGKPLTFEAVKQKLNSMNIVYGVQYDLLKRLIEGVEESKREKSEIIIARGKPPEEGEDGGLEFHFSDSEDVLRAQDEDAEGEAW